MRKAGFPVLLMVFAAAGCSIGWKNDAWRGTVRDSYVVRGSVGTFNLIRPLRQAVPWVTFPVLVPERLPGSVDLTSFVGEVVPAGTNRLFKSGKVYFGFMQPADFDVWEMRQAEWDNGGAPFATVDDCRGETVQLPTAAGDACLLTGKNGFAGIYWTTPDGVKVYITADPRGAMRWSTDDVLVVARSMVPLR